MKRWFLVLLLISVPILAQPQPEDFEYLGAFKVPFDWGQRGLSMADGGSALWIQVHDHNTKVAKISIPEPIISQVQSELNRAEVLVPSFKQINDCAQQTSWWFSGLEEVDGILRGTCAYWYNVSGSYVREYHSGLNGAAQKIGSNALKYHSNKIGTYLFELPESAVSYLGLGTQSLCAGFTNEAGAFKGSQGPPMICFDPDNPSAATDVFWYRENPPTDPPSGSYTCAGPNADGVGNCDLPNYVACDQWNGADWVSGPTGEAVIIAGRKFYGSNNYITGQGYACSPGFPELTLYDPADLKDRMLGNREPWEVLPYASWRPEERFQDRSEFAGLAFDPGTGRLYVVEKLGAGGTAIMHVWRLGEGGDPPPPGPFCGDGTCDANEDHEICPEDCPAPPPPTPECGDGICDDGEICQEDCGVEPPACDSCCPEVEPCPPAADPELELVLEGIQDFLDADCAKWRVLPKTNPLRLVMICIE